MSFIVDVEPVVAAQIEAAISGRVWPSALMPKSAPNWLLAISTPEAVMNPAITGCDRKLAMKPIRNRPIPNSIAPDNAAKVSAAVA